MKTVDREEVRHSLRERGKIRVDPYRGGFEHEEDTKDTVALSAVRLCFQVQM